MRCYGHLVLPEIHSVLISSLFFTVKLVVLTGGQKSSWASTTIKAGLIAGFAAIDLERVLRKIVEADGPCSGKVLVLGNMIEWNLEYLICSSCHAPFSSYVLDN